MFLDPGFVCRPLLCRDRLEVAGLVHSIWGGSVALQALEPDKRLAGALLARVRLLFGGWRVPPGWGAGKVENKMAGASKNCRYGPNNSAYSGFKRAGPVRPLLRGGPGDPKYDTQSLDPYRLQGDTYCGSDKTRFPGYPQRTQFALSGGEAQPPYP